MDILKEQRPKSAYHFASSDYEILDDCLLSLPCDEETWLYRVENSTTNEYGHLQLQHKFKEEIKYLSSGGVDGRTFTRRKIRPSLDSVFESPLLNNRSSLGLLSSSKLLNDSLVSQPLPHQENQEMISSNCIVSESKPPPRVFKLDTPLLNTASLEHKKVFNRNLTFNRKRMDSDCSDYSLPHSLDHINSFDQNCVMTESLTNFLEKDEVKCPPPAAFEDEGNMTNSIISLSENHADLNLDITGNNAQMTDSLVGFLEHTNCKPPSAFQDKETRTCLVDAQESRILSSFDVKKSGDPSGNINASTIISQVVPTECTISSENENIPPEDRNNERMDYRVNPNKFESKVNRSNYATYKIGNNRDLLIKNGEREINNTTMSSATSNIINRRVGQPEDDEEDVYNAPVDRFATITKGSAERKTKALNNRDLNVTRDYSDEENELNTTKVLSEPTFSINNNKINMPSDKMISTFTKNEIDETTIRQIPQRNSTFNTTFTKLESPEAKDRTIVKSMDGLNGGFEDDQTSSASDSSFSSCSTKPRSVDELRSIAQQQEISLVKHTSTPTDEDGYKKSTSNLAKLNLQLSPIRRISTGGNRANETRSANCSPVRRPSLMATPHSNLVNRMQQPAVEARRQMLQASSLCNIARPKTSGLRLPQPVSRFTNPDSNSTFTRPSTAPTPAFTGIPRPQASRLPTMRYRGSGIPGPKRGTFH